MGMHVMHVIILKINGKHFCKIEDAESLCYVCLAYDSSFKTLSMYFVQ
jgi:hypothetical protein